MQDTAFNAVYNSENRNIANLQVERQAISLVKLQREFKLLQSNPF